RRARANELLYGEVDAHRVPVARIRVDQDRDAAPRGDVADVVHHVSEAYDPFVRQSVEEGGGRRARDEEGLESSHLAHSGEERAKPAWHHQQLGSTQERSKRSSFYTIRHCHSP